MSERPHGEGSDAAPLQEPPETLAVRNDRTYRRSMRLGLLISVVLHALVFVFLSGQLYIATREFRPVRLPPRPIAGLEVIDIARIESEPATEDIILMPEERDEIERPQPPTPGAAERPAGPGADTGPGMTNAERLRPQEGDPRLWEDFSARPLPEYLEDQFARAEGLIRSRLAAMLDSLSLTEEQRRRAVEWLFGEGDQQWGVTPEGLVLGGMVIPMNVGAMFEAEGPLGRELRQEARDLADIQRQDFQTDVERTQRERLEEMRRRSEEEAARRAGDSVAVEPDTADSSGGDPRN